jgi:hypothetical protein
MHFIGSRFRLEFCGFCCTYNAGAPTTLSLSSRVSTEIPTSAPTMLKTGVGKRRDLTDTALYQEVSHEQEVYRPTFG